eukprot:3620618-Prymnesium_polylepis.1
MAEHTCQHGRPAVAECNIIDYEPFRLAHQLVSFAALALLVAWTDPGQRHGAVFALGDPHDVT